METTAWWRGFGSEELSSLITKAESQNNDLRAAAARLEQARALAKIEGASLMPTLSADGRAGRTINQKTDSSSNRYELGATLAYEVDLFGKLRDARHAAEASVQASVYDRKALTLSITAQTAEIYFDLLAATERVAIAEKNLSNARETLSLIQKRFDAGALSQLELSQQKNLVAGQEASLASLRQQREILHNQLAVIVDVLPQSFGVQASTVAALSPPTVPSVLPSALLARRPDIARLEAALVAAHFDIGVARAAFFPSLSLSAGTVLSASPHSVISSLVAAVGAPIFSGGRLEGGWERATARQQELAANYRNAALTAFAEAENALSNIEITQQRLISLRAASEEAQKAYEASRARFDAGAIDMTTLLTTQNSFFQAQDTWVRAQAERLIASVALFKALGGGVEPVQDLARP